MVKATLFLIVIAALSSCTQATVEVKQTTFLTVKDALFLLEQASNVKENKNVIDRIKNNTNSDFTWDIFWDLILEKKILLKLEKDAQSALLELHSISCLEKNFKSFSKLLLNSEKKLDYFFAPKRQCWVGLGSEMTKQVLSFFQNQSVVEEAQKIATLLSLEVRSQPQEDWSPVLNQFSLKQWEAIAFTLSESSSQDIRKLMDLMNVFQEVQGTIPFAQSLIAPALVDSAAFKFMVKKFGFYESLHLMDFSSPLLLQKLSIENKENLLTQLSKFFRDSVLDHAQDLSLIWSEYLLVRSIENKLGDEYPFVFALAWMQNLHLILEEIFLQDPAKSLKLVDYHSLDAFWLQWRLAKKLKKTDLFLALAQSELPPSFPGRLEQVLAQRLRVHLAFSHSPHFQDPEGELQEYCRGLEKFGIPKVKVPFIELSVLFSKPLQPGCFEVLDSEPGLHFEMKISQLIMPSDFVLIAPGLNLSFETQVLDGSILDLSSHLKHPDLALEDTPSEKNASVFPLVMGIQIEAPSFFRGPGIYYFMVHHTVKKAQSGIAALVLSKDGFSGGSLQLRFSPVSSAPSFLSQGSLCQKGAPPQRGGLGDLSEVTPQILERWISRLSLTPPSLPQERPKFLKNVNIGVLRSLLEQGVRNGNKELKLFVPDNLDFLDESQKKKIMKQCELLGLDLNACLKNWVTESAQLLVNQAESFDGPHSALLPELQTYQYSEPSGAMGPLNANGNAGINGEILWID